MSLMTSLVSRFRPSRLASLETSVGRLLKYGTPYASTGPVLPPVGIPAHFIDETYVSPWLRENITTGGGGRTSIWRR